MFTLARQRGLNWTKQQIYDAIHGCEICNSNVKKSHGKGHVTMSRKPGELICIDLFGPRDGKYALLMTDKATGLMYGNLIDSRSEASTAAINGLRFLINFFTSFGHHPLVLRSDNEFNTAEIQNFLNLNGMISDLTAPHSSFQNGTAERANGLIQERIAKLLNEAGADITFWPPAFKHCVFLNNILPRNRKAQNPISLAKGISLQTPTQLLAFGQEVFAYNKQEQKKLKSKGIPSVFLGYCGEGFIPTTSQVVLYGLTTGKIFKTESWRVQPDKFPLCEKEYQRVKLDLSASEWRKIFGLQFPAGQDPSQLSVETSEQNSLQRSDVPRWKVSADTPLWKNSLQVVKQTTAPVLADRHDVGAERSKRDPNKTHDAERTQETAENISVSQSTDDSPKPNASKGRMLESSISHSSDKLNQPDQNTNEMVPPDQIHDIVLYRKGGGSWDKTSKVKTKKLRWKMEHPEQRYLTKDGTSAYVQMAVCDGLYDIPNTYKQAMETPENEQWAIACNEELKSFKALHVFKEVPKTSSLKNHIVGGRWVFTVKKEISGEKFKIRFKARLVARGFKQVPGEDYFNTYAPVSKLDSFRLVLSLAVMCDWKICQLDAKNAFLNGKLDCTVYFQPPEGVDIKPGNVWMLNRSVYGLKQAPWLWYETLAKLLEKNGFRKSPTEECLFFKSGVVMLVYVDDIIIIAENQGEVDAAIGTLAKKFKMKNLGIPRLFLGMTIHCKRGQIKLSAKDTIERMVGSLDIDVSETSARQNRTPISMSLDLMNSRSKPLGYREKKEYQSVVGMLLYVSNTVRYDVSYYVSVLASYTHAPREVHYKAAEQVMRYLYWTRSQGIVYRKQGSLKISRADFKAKVGKWIDSNALYPSETTYTLTGYSDADLANSESGRSQSGGIVTLGDNVVSWISRKQSIVAKSTAESELIAMDAVTTTLTWFYELMNYMGFKVKYANLVCDNRAALFVANTSSLKKSMRGIRIRYLALVNEVRARRLRLWKVASKDNPADFLTKRLDTAKFVHDLTQLLKFE